MTTRQERIDKAAGLFTAGLSRHPYGLHKDIVRGMASVVVGNQSQRSCCPKCSSLLDLKDVFVNLIHSGGDLRRRRAIYPKSGSASYRDITKQNDFLIKSVFDARGNYLYHRDCIRLVFGVSNQRLSRLRKCVQVENSGPTEYLNKDDIYKCKRMSDVVLPRGCDQVTKVWVETQSDHVPLECKKRPGLHRNAKKRSNNALSDAILERFIAFVDKNSAPNGRKEGSYGKTYYFDRKFTQIRTPNKTDPQFQYKSKHSVLHEFNRTLAEDGLQTISVGTFHNWLKKYRRYIGICPSMSDYCDTCKELEEEICRCRQRVNRLIQSGHALESTCKYLHDFVCMCACRGTIQIYTTSIMYVSHAYISAFQFR